MNQAAWEEIEKIYTLPSVESKAIELFRQLKSKQSSHTRAQDNLDHYCSFFLPFDKKEGKIYLGDHIKAGGWIPPGGHIEEGESPSDAAIREMEEELKVKITLDMLEPFDLSVTVVNRPEKGCMTHYDVWHLVNIAEQTFDFDRREYHDAGWFPIAEGVKKITKNLDFAAIITSLQGQALQGDTQ